MIGAPLRAGRAAGYVVLAAVLWSVHAGAAHAQGACDSQPVKDYIADFGGARAQPPAAWQVCIDSLGIDPLEPYKGAILRSFTALRSRTGPAREPNDAERSIFRGSDRIVITPAILEGWRRNFGVQRAEQRFESTFYRALLGSLAWIVIARSGQLQGDCVEPVDRLQRALSGGPVWRDVESFLLAFRDIPLWPNRGRQEVSLTALNELAAGLSAADSGIACAGIRTLAQGPGYWPGVSDKLKPQAGTFVVRIPGDCALGACQAARDWARTPTPEGWGGVRQRYDADLAATVRRLESVKNALPGGATWSRVTTHLDVLRGHADRFRGAGEPGGRDMVPQVEKGLADLNYLTKLADNFEDLLAYKKAIRSLLGGNAVRARAAVKERRSWTQAPHLVAAYVASAYWEKGDTGRRAACGERGLNCSNPEVAAELARIATILKLEDGALSP